MSSNRVTTPSGSSPKRSTSKSVGGTSILRPLVIVMVVGITLGNMMMQQGGGQSRKALLGSSDSVEDSHAQQREELQTNNNNQRLEILQKELEEVKALKAASEQDFASLRSELSQLVKAQKEVLSSSSAESAPKNNNNNNDLISMQEIEMGFGDSNNSTGSKYSPTPLLKLNLKLEVGTEKWRQDIGYTSPACTLQADDGTTFDRIVFLHMRKAGGTSVRNYLRNVAARHKVPLKIMEGWTLVEKPGDVPNTLYVTHMREPVSRAISHYKYEIRWDCPKQHRVSGFVPTLENQQMNLTQFALKDWRAGSRKYWTCSSECYTRWSTGLFHNPRTDPVMAPAGTKTMGGYHLVIVSEWLQDPDYARSLESIFGEKYIGRKTGMTCGEEAKKANKMVPLTIDEETYDLLGARNQIDIGIYKNLTTCRYGPQFWGRHISFKPWEEGMKRHKGDELYHKKWEQKE